MIPRLARVDSTHDLYLAFLEAARAAGFRGELESRYAARIAAATDNSVYQILPQAVAFPRDAADVAVLARLSNEPRFHDIALTPRGGGTGTNGQSLTDGLMVDLSRHMNRIIEIDPARRVARVQAGVVKDQLEAALEPHGLFFAPELSTSNRATIGGMVSTDASGQGSVRYGKTRDHVLALTSVFLDGTVFESAPAAAAEFDRMRARADRVGALCRAAAAEVDANAALIREKFPKLNRCLTGYDLAHARGADGRFDLNALLCGSEGTLAFVVEATLNLLPEPAHKALVTIGYASFDQALRSARALMAAQPASIETIDASVLDMARADIVWDGVRDCFPSDSSNPGALRGVNIVEFAGADSAAVASQIDALARRLDAQPESAGLGYRIVRDAAAVKRVWAMRKRAVGLLGNVAGERRPVPFVEDTAVPPEHLADYIAEFRAVLDREGLFYGMFGHVDAGVLHVRPALDMKDAADAARLRRVSDEVAALTRKYGGLLWGEHGKGMRSEYVPRFFGALYPCLQRIKAAADPRNQLNPGKICAPPGFESKLARIDAPTRGQRDRAIPAAARAEFEPALVCNGNGACFNFDPNDAMCPSWKATRDRVHSPKGRAGLMREWLRLAAAAPPQSDGGFARLRRMIPLGALKLHESRESPESHDSRGRGAFDFSHEVAAAMAGCLSCKSCATQCPVRVDVAELRSQFLERYHGRYPRPLRHYIVTGMEAALPLAARAPRVFNRLAQSALGRRLTRTVAGLVDSPALAEIDLGRELRARGFSWADAATPRALPAQQRARGVIVLQDAFTSYFETGLVLDVLELLRRLGFEPLLAPYKPNGKALHVHGMRARFARTAAANARHLRALAESGLPLVGIEPAIVLTYRQEYVAALGADAPRVALLQEWLAARPDVLRRHARAAAAPFTLFAHCTERTAAAAAIAAWQQVFAALGQSLEVPALGCCGMAGTYGHEREHAPTSRAIYALSWAAAVNAGVNETANDPARRERLLATGYSCRAQVKRIDGVRLAHPAQALLRLLDS